jgi:hypothetical protein
MPTWPVIASLEHGARPLRSIQEKDHPVATSWAEWHHISIIFRQEHSNHLDLAFIHQDVFLSSGTLEPHQASIARQVPHRPFTASPFSTTYLSSCNVITYNIPIHSSPHQEASHD